MEIRPVAAALKHSDIRLDTQASRDYAKVPVTWCNNAICPYNKGLYEFIKFCFIKVVPYCIPTTLPLLPARHTRF
jgi:hypothetical protein